MSDAMRKWNSVCYVHGPDIGMISFMLISALAEVLCGLGVDEFMRTWVAFPAAGVFASIALGFVLGIIRFERKYA